MSTREHETTPSGAPVASVRGLVVRNTLYLTIAQALTVPFAVIVNAALGRYLGPAEFGNIYLAATITGVGFLLVDWGHVGAVPALVARERSSAGRVLGTSLVWKLVVGTVVYAVLAFGVRVLGYGTGLQWALGLTFLGWLLNSAVGACKDTIRGFERTDIPSYVHVAQQVLNTLLVVLVLLLGGRMRMALLASVVAALAVVVPIWRSLRPVGVGKLAYDRKTARALLVEGTPFAFFGVAMVLVPYIDATYLSKLAPSETMGWYAASRRLIGVLLLPSSALVNALYPTLCRLWATDQQTFRSTVSGSLRGTALLIVPVAIGCALYPDIGVSIFSRKSFGPAEDNLRMSAVFLCLLYVSMPVGTALLASGRQRVWAVAQGFSVLGSLALDPIFIPWFQAKFGNGGVGLWATSAVNELVVVTFGIVLMPKGIFDRRLARSFGLAVLSGGAMVAVALATRPVLGPFLSAPLALIAYGAGLWLTKAIEPEQLAMLLGLLGKKLARFGVGAKSRSDTS